MMAKVPDASDAAAKFRADAERARRVGDSLNLRDRDNLRRYATELEGKAAAMEASAVAPQRPAESVVPQPVEVVTETPAEVPASWPLGDATNSN